MRPKGEGGNLPPSKCPAPAVSPSTTNQVNPETNTMSSCKTLFMRLMLLAAGFSFLCSAVPLPSEVSIMDNSSDHRNGSTFLYFAYGSNLLKERLQLKNPSAIIHCVAKLKDYKLVFGNHKGVASQRWRGGVATIEHSPGEEVWGVVWRMNVTDIESLDRQENVKMGTYSPMKVFVSTTDQDLHCRTYIMNSCVYAPPSPHYLEVIVMGAEQNGLPEDYQEKLKSIETNKYEGRLSVMEELEKAMKKSKERTQEILSDDIPS
ncbi:gamma-glutamylcyclotransferase b [Rhinichthys klamathensis goyatoka]|uniref:gamma-glutamylcyclotransferase b n=1 Tax=Rhinichthys klamathensis goyatoka TaxID=3034132 RepID=UPI0024B5C1CF|nr:gamma-glutamylcyclotransferase b [Rhinichthys klamathensis goyatoka]